MRAPHSPQLQCPLSGVHCHVASGHNRPAWDGWSGWWERQRWQIRNQGTEQLCSWFRHFSSRGSWCRIRRQNQGTEQPCSWFWHFLQDCCDKIRRRKIHFLHLSLSSLVPPHFTKKIMIFTEDITILKLYLRLFVFYDFMKNKSMAKNSPSHFQIGVASESRLNTFLH